MNVHDFRCDDNLWKAIKDAAWNNRVSANGFIRLVLAEKLGISLEEQQLNIITSKEDLLKDNQDALKKIKTIVKKKEQENLPIESKLLKIINKGDKTYIERKMKVKVKEDRNDSFKPYFEVIYPTDDGKLRKKEFDEDKIDLFMSFGVKLGFRISELRMLSQGKEVGYKKTFISTISIND